MIEIRLHGLGGQGVVTSAEIIAIAAFKQGLQTQAFPFFGVERTGTPVEAYVRLDQQPIKTREHIYQPDWLIILDDKTLKEPATKIGLTTKTKVLINSQQTPATLAQTLGIKTKQITVVQLPNQANLNTAIIGAWAKQSGLLSLTSLQQAITEKFIDKDNKIIKANLATITQTYGQA